MDSGGPIILAADGGATASRVLVASLDGTVLWQGRGPAASATRNGPQDAGRVLADQWLSALRSLGLEGSSVRAAACGLAGARPGSIQQKVCESLRRVLSGADVEEGLPIEVTHDASIALRGAFPLSGGCVVISGTGSVAAARRPGGTPVLVGGWGWPLGDEGSGTWLGWRAAQEAAAELEQGSEGVYTGILRQGWGLGDGEEGGLHALLRSAVEACGDASRWSSLAPLVMQSLRSSPEPTRPLLCEMGIRLGLLASVALARVGWPEEEEAPVALTGGVGSRLRDLLEAPFRDGAGVYGEVLSWTSERLTHLGGAALLALEAAGETPDEEVLDRLGREVAG